MIQQIFIITVMTVLEGLRNRTMLGMLLFVAAASSVSLMIVPMFAFDQSKVLLDFGFAFMQLAGLAIIFFLGISMVAHDIQHRSACIMLGRSVSRRNYLLGRYLGLAVVLFTAMAAVIVITSGGGLIALNKFTDSPLPRNFSFSVFLVVFFASYLSHALLLAVAFLFSIATTNVYLSMLSTLGIYITGQSLETIVRIVLQGDFVQLNSLYIKLLQGVSWLLPNLRAFDFKVYLLYGLPLPMEQIAITFLYGILYVTFLLTLTNLAFARKDI